MHDELMLTNTLLQKNTAEKTAVCTWIRLPWYRSIPLSGVMDLIFHVDGKKIPRENVKLEFNGILYALDELTPLVDTLWFVRDAALAHLELSVPLSPGTHKVELSMQLQIPYMDKVDIENGRADFFQWAKCKKIMSFEGRGA